MVEPVESSCVTDVRQKLFLNATSKSVPATESADSWLVSQISETISLTQEQADVMNEKKSKGPNVRGETGS